MGVSRSCYREDEMGFCDAAVEVEIFSPSNRVCLSLSIERAFGVRMVNVSLCMC